jgi:DNA repair protein SbcC/Rad50
MKIKEFLITRYGPLKETGKILLDKFNLFFGKNEEGKSLTIDAFVKLLLGKNMKNFQKINRVDEKPEGYIIIEDDNGKAIKLSKQKDLTKTVGLSASECRNIFIIRDSDLSITQEGEFYANITDRLTGLRTKEISSIKKKLQEIGRLTRAESNADFSDKKEFNNIKSRLNSAAKLLEEIDSLKSKISEEKFDQLEEESVKHKEEIEWTEQELVNLENARKREKYEKGRECLDNLTDTLEKYHNLEIYNDKDLQTWRDCRKDIQNYREERKGHLEALQQNETESKKANEILRETETDFKIFEDIKRRLDNEIKPELKTYENKSADLIKKERMDGYVSLIGIISTILFGISLLGVIFNTKLDVILDTSFPLFYILSGFFLILMLISGGAKFQFVKDNAWLAREFETIKSNLSKYELDAKDIGGVLSNIQKFDEEFYKKNNELQSVKRKKESFEDKISELRNIIIPNIDKKIKDSEDKIDKIKIKSEEESLEEYIKKIKLKKEFKRLTEEQKSVLKSHFGGNNEILEESILQWGKSIETFAEYKEKSKEIKYSDNAVSKLEGKKQELSQKLKEINDKMVSLQKEMESVQRKVNEILEAEEEYLYCKTSVDLEMVEDKLHRFINKNTSDKDNVLEVIKIFEEIEIEEREKVSELFGKESPISNYFDEITDGFYKEVTFNQETGGIEVERLDGKKLGAEKLSGGAHDQLYFSIRLALGEKLLKGNKGFFVLDDPFVKADPDRLERQIATLKNIIKYGWQIIYFSAKGEIHDALKEDIENNIVKNIKLQGLSLENVNLESQDLDL